MEAKQKFEKMEDQVSQRASRAIKLSPRVRIPARENSKAVPQYQQKLGKQPQ